MIVQYFASLREIIGLAEEEITLPAGVTSIRELLDYLQTKGATYDQAFRERVYIRAALNEKVVDLDSKISNGDIISFFPPFTGG